MRKCKKCGYKFKTQEKEITRNYKKNLKILNRILCRVCEREEERNNK